METTETPDPKDYLLFGLHHYALEILAQTDHKVQVAGGYEIEIEGPDLYKLSAHTSIFH